MLREALALRRRLALGTVAAAACLLAFAGPAQADFVVDDLNDPPTVGAADTICDSDQAPGGDGCTLREAIREANFTVAHDTITFSVTGTHSMAGQMNPTEPITIDGNGSGMSGTVIDGIDAFRLFLLSNNATATFRDLRLQDGGIVDPNGDGGAAIRTTNLGLTLDNVTVTSNQITGAGDGRGAGILSDLPTGQTVTITDSTINANTISSAGNNSGAGIFSSDALNVTDSIVSGNMITAGTSISGAGIKQSSDLNMQGSTVSFNQLVTAGSVPTVGAGIHAFADVGPKTIANSTFSGNTAGDGVSDRGGGAAIDDAATITSSTFANNAAAVGPDNGADISAGNGTVTLKDTILASGPTACDVATASAGAFASAGNNIDVGTSCGFGTSNGNQQNVADVMLGPLALNAPGTTPTHALMPGSPAIGAGSLTGLPTDQRGVARPQGTFCDIGSFELEATNNAPSCAGFPAVVPPVLTPTPTPTTPAAPKKKCKKGRKLKKGKCVKKKRKKK